MKKVPLTFLQNSLENSYANVYERLKKSLKKVLPKIVMQKNKTKEEEVKNSSGLSNFKLLLITMRRSSLKIT